MFNIGPAELLVIGLVLLIAVGPEQLPGVIRRVGSTVAQLRSMTDGLRTEFMAGLDEIERATDVERWSSDDDDDDDLDDLDDLDDGLDQLDDDRDELGGGQDAVDDDRDELDDDQDQDQDVLGDDPGASNQRSNGGSTAPAWGASANGRATLDGSAGATRPAPEPTVPGDEEGST